MSVNAWIVVGDQPTIGNLITVARSLGGPVGAVVAGPRSVAETVAASGLDRVVIIEDDSLREAGRSELAAVLAAAVRRIGDVDLIITGDSSVDVAAKMVPTVLAGELGWPAVAEVTAVTGQAGALRVERAIPGGVQVLEISGPAVLAASADAAVPHVPGMKELLAAGKKPVDLLELTALDVPARSAVMPVTGRARPERKARTGQLIDTRDPAAAAAELVTALRTAGAL